MTDPRDAHPTVSGLTRALGVANADLAAARAEIEKLRRWHEAIPAGKMAAAEQIAGLRADLAAAEEELGPFVADNAVLRAEIERLNNEMDRTIEATNHELTRLRAEIADKKSVIDYVCDQFEVPHSGDEACIASRGAAREIAEVVTLRAQLDAARAGLVAARACLVRGMLRAREGAGAEWAAIHSELFCGVRDADQVLTSLPTAASPPTGNEITGVEQEETLDEKA